MKPGDTVHLDDGPAAARWHAKFVLKAKGVALEESQLALTALALLPQERDAGLRMLVGLAKERSVYVGAHRE